MSASERQQQFEKAIKALPEVRPEARIAANFGFSNSARVVEGGLFACTNNLENYSEKLVAGTTAIEQMVLLCVLTFPPQDEVYFAISVKSDIGRLNGGLLKLHAEGAERNKSLISASKKPGSISNNVKFYITDSGELFFHNYDFKDSLTEARAKGELDPDCLAKIDGIYFAIWPPAASARRSLLARNFVGYLGALIGREKVHELRVWDEAGAVSPEMRRMPATLLVDDIEAAIAALGGHHPGGEVRRFHAALNFLRSKHFVILAGLSGTGKRSWRSSTPGRCMD
jgi:5-methylcytosine-specific restriction enzyme B